MAAGDNRFGFAFARRLKSPAEFAAVLSASREQSIRAARQMLSIHVAWAPAAGVSRVRFGVTVGTRNARRSVDRALVKRIVREACRHQAAAFETCAGKASARVDIVLRMKAPLVDADGAPLAMRRWRRQVRAEADDLLASALSRLTAQLAKCTED